MTLQEMMTHLDGTELDLRGQDITDDDLKHLKEIPFVEMLDLSGTKIGDDALIHVKNLQKLKWLDLVDTQVTDDGLRHLYEMNSLKRVYLDGTIIWSSAASKLEDALPNCYVYYSE